MYIVCQNTSVASACILSNPAVQKSIYPVLPINRNTHYGINYEPLPNDSLAAEPKVLK
jgi:hypothetical protein